jgi:hypothetical protein
MRLRRRAQAETTSRSSLESELNSRLLRRVIIRACDGDPIGMPIRRPGGCRACRANDDGVAMTRIATERRGRGCRVRLIDGSAWAALAGTTPASTPARVDGGNTPPPRRAPRPAGLSLPESRRLQRSDLRRADAPARDAQRRSFSPRTGPLCEDVDRDQPGDCPDNSHEHSDARYTVPARRFDAGRRRLESCLVLVGNCREELIFGVDAVPLAAHAPHRSTLC